MKKTNWLKRLISMYLVVILVIQLLPLQSFALNLENKRIEKEITVPIKIDDSLILSESEIGEIENLRDSTTKHFRNPDGTYSAIMYSQPIHYEENGIWKEIDMSLSLSKDQQSYETQATNHPINIPLSLDNNQRVTLTNDGYSIGFGVSNQNNRVKLDAIANIMSVKNLASSTLVRKEEQINDNPEYLLENEISEKASSAATYKNIFPDADLEYIFSSNRIKENIIVYKQQKSYEYKFDIDLDGLIPVHQENNSIWLLENEDDTEPMFILEAPYMYDADSEISYNVSMSLQEETNQHILIITADDEWLNNENRVFPVVIDPTVVMNTGSNIEDVYVSTLGSNFNYGTADQFNTGKDVISRSRSYIKFTLPELPSGSIVSSSKMALYRKSGSLRDFHLNVYDLSGLRFWKEQTITWNSQPIENPWAFLPEEAHVLTRSGSKYWLEFDITKATKRWYEGYNNNGLLITSSNESYLNDVYFHSSESSDTSLRPRLIITYTPDPYSEFIKTYSKKMTFDTDTLSSHTYDAGRAGNLKIDDFSLDWTLSFNDIGINGNIMPVSILHNYNTSMLNFMKNTLNLTPTSYGNGWLLNYNQFIRILTFSNNRLLIVFFDAKGDMHLFEKDAEYNGTESEKWLGINSDIYTLWKQTDGTFRMEDQNTGNNLYFDSQLRLCEMKNAKNEGLSIKITYNGLLESISSIKDGVGREYRFKYSNGRLSSIKCYNNDGNAISFSAYDAINNTYTTVSPGVSYSYINDCLTSVTYDDNLSTNYGYDTAKRLISFENIDKQRIELTYNTKEEISCIAEKAFDITNNTYMFINKTVIREDISDNDWKRTFEDMFGYEARVFDRDGVLKDILDRFNLSILDLPDLSGINVEINSDEEEPTQQLLCVCGEDCAYGNDCPCACTNAESCECVQCDKGDRCVCEDCTETSCPCRCIANCDCLPCKRTRVTQTDTYGNITEESISDGIKTMTTYNSFSADGNYTTSTTDAMGNKLYYEYDKDTGLLTKTTNGEGKETLYTYDAMRTLATVTQNIDGSNSTRSNIYSYKNDRLNVIKTGNGTVYSFIYDMRGNELSTAVNSNIISSNTYDSGAYANRLKSIDFANGQNISYTYDEKGNIVGISFDGGISYAYEYIYNDEEDIKKCIDNQSQIVTIYNDNGYQISLLHDENKILYEASYDADSNFIETVNGYAFIYSYDSFYDAANGITTDKVSVESLLGNTVDIETSKDWFGRLISKSRSVSDSNNQNKVKVDSRYSYADIVDVASTKVSSYESLITTLAGQYDRSLQYDYTFDGNYNITSVTLDSSLLKKYKYDEAQQLIREDNADIGQTITYNYDNHGNIIEKNIYAFTTGALASSLETIVYNYDNNDWPDLLTGYANEQIIYDSVGNPIAVLGGAEGPKYYFWTAGRRLTHAIIPSYGEHSLVSYYYDVNGILTAKKIASIENFVSPQELNIEYLRNNWSLSIFEYNVLEEIIIRYVWNNSKLSTVSLEGESTNDCVNMHILYDNCGESFGVAIYSAADEDITILLYEKNLQGDITSLVNQDDGRVYLYYDYDAYGNISIRPGEFYENTVGDFMAITYAIMNPLIYKGYLVDMTTGLFYLQSRYYVPEWGRFLNADSYLDTGTGLLGTNAYTYCDDNPVNRIDPTGEWGKDVHRGYDIKTNKRSKIYELTISSLNDKNIYKYGTFYWITRDGKRLIDDYSAMFIAEACNEVDRWFPPATPSTTAMLNLEYGQPTYGQWVITDIQPPSKRNQMWHFNIYGKGGPDERDYDSRDVCYRAAAMATLIYVGAAVQNYDLYRSSGDVQYLKNYIATRIGALALMGASMHPIQDKFAHIHDENTPTREKGSGVVKYNRLGFWHHLGISAKQRNTDKASVHWDVINSDVREITKDIMLDYQWGYSKTIFFNDGGLFENYVKNNIKNNYSLKIINP